MKISALIRCAAKSEDEIVKLRIRKLEQLIETRAVDRIPGKTYDIRNMYRDLNLHPSDVIDEVAYLMFHRQKQVIVPLVGKEFSAKEMKSTVMGKVINHFGDKGWKFFPTNLAFRLI